MTGIETALIAAGMSASTAATIGTVASVVGGIGSVVGAVGSIASGNAAKRAGDYNAQVGQINANAAVADAAENARRQRRLNAKAAGTIRNKEGYSMDVLEDNVREGELMALDLIHQGDVKAAGLRSGAALDRMQGKAAQTAGYVGAASKLMSMDLSGVNGSSPSSGSPMVGNTLTYASSYSPGQGIY
jgi:hypothetical protein